MAMTTFVGFTLFAALAIWGRNLRERAYLALPAEQKIQIADKMTPCDLRRVFLFS